MKRRLPSVAPPRRRAFVALGGGALVLTASRAFGATAPSPPACVLTPRQTEGPYFVDERLQRADIRSDPRDGSVRPGVPLALGLRIFAVRDGGCEPLRDAIVDLWQCDAHGVYSDTAQARGAKFLRGFQRTGAQGNVRFTTIYPGAYPGRAVHIHFKVRLPGAEFTSQLYFDDALTDRVHAQAPYAGAQERRTRNRSDGIYRRGGAQLMLDLVPSGDGYAAAYDVGVRV